MRPRWAGQLVALRREAQRLATGIRTPTITQAGHVRQMHALTPADTVSSLARRSYSACLRIDWAAAGGVYDFADGVTVGRSTAILSTSLVRFRWVAQILRVRGLDGRSREAR